MTVETFAPRVMVDGQAVTPEGWMWVLAFAIRGCDWAIEEASKPEFREGVVKSLMERQRKQIEESIDHHFKMIETLKKELGRLA